VHDLRTPSYEAEKWHTTEENKIITQEHRHKETYDKDGYDQNGTNISE